MGKSSFCIRLIRDGRAVVASWLDRLAYVDTRWSHVVDDSLAFCTALVSCTLQTLVVVYTPASSSLFDTLAFSRTRWTLDDRRAF